MNYDNWKTTDVEFERASAAQAALDDKCAALEIFWKTKLEELFEGWGHRLHGEVLVEATDDGPILEFRPVFRYSLSENNKVDSHAIGSDLITIGKDMMGNNGK